MHNNNDVRIVPVHIAIIMDGNGRWAEKRKLPRIMGHREGLETVRRVITTADDEGVRFLTLYSFSTENWRRPEEEVRFLFTLMEQNLRKESVELNKKNVRVRFIGQRDQLPEFLQKSMSDIENLTLKNDGLTLILAINYGGRQEVTSAVKRILAEGCAEKDVNEELIEKYLDTSDIPDPDLIIRTSGEERLSNFLLWQSAYSELYFTKVLWPDFSKEDFLEALSSYQKRKRKFGGILR